MNDILIDILWSGRERWLKLAFLCLEQNPTPLLPNPIHPGKDSERMEQATEGFVAVMIQSLQGDASSLMRFYVESIFPDAFAVRKDFDAVLHTVISFTVLFSSEVISLLPPEHKSQGALWLSQFFAEYIREIVRVGRKILPTGAEKPGA